jgi:hypothetical protein
MRLMKLFAIVLLSYLGYRLYREMEEGGISNGGQSSRRLRQAMDEESGRMQTLSGPGRGTTVNVQDASGAQGSRVVGRGVIPR